MFFKNLCPSTKIYFLENGIKTRAQALEKARSIENLLIQLDEEDTLKEPTVQKSSTSNTIVTKVTKPESKQGV
ncbi:hypothetical protein A0H76_1308 [Hepatospora eriocheir]|uniref:Uncharacterized protein n=1 Tax=Hepatospora eriocheir TaxID=1081669 RepID=A0A1X0QKR8_9MICR|nr:hypothetical protein A0H76_1308 [Hepatospora eriocheir]